MVGELLKRIGCEIDVGCNPYICQFRIELHKYSVFLLKVTFGRHPRDRRFVGKEVIQRPDWNPGTS